MEKLRTRRRITDFLEFKFVIGASTSCSIAENDRNVKERLLDSLLLVEEEKIEEVSFFGCWVASFFSNSFVLFLVFIIKTFNT